MNGFTGFVVVFDIFSLGDCSNVSNYYYSERIANILVSNIYLPQVFYSLMKVCIEPKYVNLSKLNARAGFARTSIHFNRGEISSSVSWQHFTFALVGS